MWYTNVVSAASVSYTHLDVYKRQAVQRATLDVVQNDFMRLGVRVGDPTLHLVVHGCIGQKAEEMCIRDSVCIWHNKEIPIRITINPRQNVIFSN